MIYPYEKDGSRNAWDIVQWCMKDAVGAEEFLILHSAMYFSMLENVLSMTGIDWGKCAKDPFAPRSHQRPSTYATTFNTGY